VSRAAFDERAYRRATEALAAEALEKVRAAALAEDVACDTLAITDDHPWQGIVKAARQCDLIVMASHGRKGIQALLLGSETNKVLTHTKITVLAIHSD